jgi:prepilin-type N-terminal cleavage/methylation domain-containing protein/prepilin-type processing-associated H-X9-DG protein
MSSNRRHRRRAFTVIEVLVVIGIMALLMGILLPTIERVRHKAYIANCASNLRQVGVYLLTYSNEHRGALPRTVYVPGAVLQHGTGIMAPDPFQSGGPLPNDLTAAVFLLLRVQHLAPELLNCPYDDVHEYQPQKGDPQGQSNFSDFKVSLGYSFANMYPSAAAAAAGYKWSGRLGAEFAVAADMNPGTKKPYNDVLGATPTSPSAVMKKANSANHERDGQNVLFGDGHVAWSQTPFVGPEGDNIFTTRDGQVEASPVDKDDCVLLPSEDD